MQDIGFRFSFWLGEGERGEGGGGKGAGGGLCTHAAGQFLAAILQLEAQ